MLHCRQGDLFSICFILLPPDIPLIYRPEKFQFCFIAPQNRIPKLWWLIYMVFSILEPTFLCFWVSSGVCLWCPFSRMATVALISGTMAYSIPPDYCCS